MRNGPCEGGNVTGQSIHSEGGGGQGCGTEENGVEKIWPVKSKHQCNVWCKIPRLWHNKRRL